MRNAIDVVTTVALLAAAAVVIWTSALRGRNAAAARPPVPIPTEPIDVSEAAIIGPLTAPVGIVEFADFECPFCGRFATDTLPELRAQYIDRGRVMFAFRHNPLKIHDQAEAAAVASECALRQGRFWEFHDSLFRHPQTLDKKSLTQDAIAIGLNLEDFQACIAADVSVKVKSEGDFAQSLKLVGTPAFMIGTLGRDKRVRVSEIITGAKPLTVFAEAIDRIENAAKRD